jgi:hypothetical protein
MASRRGGRSHRVESARTRDPQLRRRARVGRPRVRGPGSQQLEKRVQKTVLAGSRRGGSASAVRAVKQSQILTLQLRFAMAFSSLSDYPLVAFSFPGGGGAMGLPYSGRDPGTGPSTHSAKHSTTGQSPGGGECVAECARLYLVGRPSGPKGPTKPTQRTEPTKPTEPTKLVRWSTKRGRAKRGDAAVRSRVGAHGSS